MKPNFQVNLKTEPLYAVLFKVKLHTFKTFWSKIKTKRSWFSLRLSKMPENLKN
jgi:hypothetical protein